MVDGPVLVQNVQAERTTEGSKRSRAKHDESKELAGSSRDDKGANERERRMEAHTHHQSFEGWSVRARRQLWRRAEATTAEATTAEARGRRQLGDGGSLGRRRSGMTHGAKNVRSYYVAAPVF